MTPEQFRETFCVSRETRERLEVFVELLAHWNPRINLVSPRSLRDVWARHIADSVQLLALAPSSAHSWIDLGAGGGLPGLPVAALAAEAAPALHITLVESDRRKSAFIATAARAMGLDVTLLPCRAEAVPAQPHDVVSARALASLQTLCALAYRFKGRGTVFLFPKGAQVDSELTAAAASWHIRFERIASRTNPEAAVLRIVELEPRT